MNKRRPISTQLWALYVESSNYDVRGVTLHDSERKALIGAADYLRIGNERDKRLSATRLARMTDDTLRQHLHDYVNESDTDDEWLVERVQPPPLFAAAPLMAHILRSLVNPKSTSDIERQAHALLRRIAKSVPTITTAGRDLAQWVVDNDPGKREDETDQEWHERLGTWHAHVRALSEVALKSGY
jgi:hypothetical protein